MKSIRNKAALTTVAATAAFLFLGSTPAMALGAFYDLASLDMPIGALESAGHALVYAALTLLLIPKKAGDRRWAKTALALTAVGVAIEIAQGVSLGGRSFELVDILANTLGIAAAITFLAATREIRELAPNRLRRA